LGYTLGEFFTISSGHSAKVLKNSAVQTDKKYENGQQAFRQTLADSIVQ
jgi:hypothetical protein